jgi:predicted helicase
MKVADTHGIVYTPQPIVNFMVKSVEDILQREFGKSLSDKGVHILDPFVGTGNFIVRVMQEIRKTALPYKYEHELHCNEVMLLPYYIASMNIEHEYLELAGSYKPFEGVCLVDTFELAEEQQLSLFTAENTARVERQRQSPIFVIMGNPPYNANQVNENDNNKNRKYKLIDKRVAETYVKDSKATNKNALSDPYVKAIRWASDRIEREGIIALVTNNSFINDIAFDGIRKHLERDFESIYILDLGGNVKKNSKLSGTTHNVFQIQVGVSINLFVKKENKQDSISSGIHYARANEFWRKEDKYQYLEEAQSNSNITWQILKPDQKNNWLTEGRLDEFDDFISIGNKEAKSSDHINTETIFKNYSRGVATARDAWTYNFNRTLLTENIKNTIEVYNEYVFRWLHRKNQEIKIEDLIKNEDKKLSWSRDLKLDLSRGR